MNHRSCLAASAASCLVLLALPMTAQALKPKPGRYLMNPPIGGEAVIEVNQKRTAFTILSLGYSPASAPNSAPSRSSLSRPICSIPRQTSSSVAE